MHSLSNRFRHSTRASECDAIRYEPVEGKTVLTMIEAIHRGTNLTMSIRENRAARLASSQAPQRNWVKN